jgi:hypothetical protein
MYLIVLNLPPFMEGMFNDLILRNGMNLSHGRDPVSDFIMNPPETALI